VKEVSIRTHCASVGIGRCLAIRDRGSAAIARGQIIASLAGFAGTLCMNDITFIRTGLADVHIGSDTGIIVAIIAAYTVVAAGGADWASTVGWTTHTRLRGRIPDPVSRT